MNSASTAQPVPQIEVQPAEEKLLTDVQRVRRLAFQEFTVHTGTVRISRRGLPEAELHNTQQVLER